MSKKCIECGKFISKSEEIFCKRCIEKQKNNSKLQRLLKGSILLPLRSFI